MSEFCPDFDYKFEEYDIYENMLTDGNFVRYLSGEITSSIGTIVIIFTKKD